MSPRSDTKHLDTMHLDAANLDAMHLDAMASAIASGPRRAMLTRLAAGPAQLSELADLTGATLPTTIRHLNLLIEAKLVQRNKIGRTVIVTTVPGALQPLLDWAAATRLMWASQLDRLAGHLSASQNPASQKPPRSSPAVPHRKPAAPNRKSVAPHRKDVP